MSKEKQIKIPEEEMGMSGYSKYSLALHRTKKFTMAQAELADRIMREEGYRKQSEGEWVWKSNGYMKYLHCSCCGRQEEWETAFCPNCGAKMKGGAE